ncbi:MAG: cupin domain-containing protein [Caulobacteraceae bacterium]
MKKIDVASLTALTGSGYPSPYGEPCMTRSRKRLGLAGRLSQFGVNLLTLPPGAWSSQRHWHSHEDEFVFVVQGEVSLVTDAGEEVLGPGDCAAFKAGDPDGHHLINRTAADAIVLEVGDNDPPRDRCVYPDADMIAEPGEDHYRRRDGTPYPKVER